jgi:hypothetical protein
MEGGPSTLVVCSCRDHNTLEPLISVFDTWVVENVAAGLNFDRRDNPKFTISHHASQRPIRSALTVGLIGVRREDDFGEPTRSFETSSSRFCPDEKLHFIQIGGNLPYVASVQRPITPAKPHRSAHPNYRNSRDLIPPEY